MPRDPRVSLFCAIALCSTIACLGSLCASVLSLIAGFLLLFTSRATIADLYSRFMAVNIFIFFMWLIVPWTTPGERLTPGLPLSIAGLQLCLLITVKANAILAVFLAFLSRMPMITMACALRSLRIPEKLVWLFLLMERNVATIGEEWHKLTVAAKLRGFAPCTNLHTYKTIAALIALLFLGAHARGEHMREAMLLRGFDGSLHLARSFSPLCIRDTLFVISIAGGILILSYINYISI